MEQRLNKHWRESNWVSTALWDVFKHGTNSGTNRITLLCNMLWFVCSCSKNYHYIIQGKNHSYIHVYMYVFGITNKTVYLHSSSFLSIPQVYAKHGISWRKIISLVFGIPFCVPYHQNMQGESTVAILRYCRSLLNVYTGLPSSSKFCDSDVRDYLQDIANKN